MTARLASSGTAETLAAAGVLAMLALVLAARGHVERRRRLEPESPLDRTYYRFKNLRRQVGSALMLAIAALMALSTRIDVRASRSGSSLWGWTWLVVLGLVGLLLLLAFTDWTANQRFGRRHRRALLAEQRELLADLARARRARDRRSRRDPSLN